jgi:hypothetical protein
MKTRQKWLLQIAVLANLSLGISASVADSSVTIVNCAGLDFTNMETVRAHAERELYITVISTNVLSQRGKDLQDIGMIAAKTKKNNKDYLIVLGMPSEISAIQYAIMTNEQVAIINVPAVTSTNAAVTTRRLQRLTMRAAASLFGIGSDPDPFCVMHDYRTLNDLDRMGMNFSPPWGDKFRQAAKARGLTVRPLFTPRPMPVTTNAVPLAPVPVKGN